MLYCFVLFCTLYLKKVVHVVDQHDLTFNSMITSTEERRGRHHLEKRSYTNECINNSFLPRVLARLGGRIPQIHHEAETCFALSVLQLHERSQLPVCIQLNKKYPFLVVEITPFWRMHEIISVRAVPPGSTTARFFCASAMKDSLKSWSGCDKLSGRFASRLHEEILGTGDK